MSSSSNITLYAHNGGPNPPKVAILLQKLGLQHDLQIRVFGSQEGGVKHPDYLKINPNGRLPAIIDHKNNDLTVWESGACLIYLAEKYDAEGKYYGKTPEDKAIVAQWLCYQISGLGPAQGNAYAANYWKHTYGEEAPVNVVKRFSDETHRLYKVLDEQLAKQEWVALDRPTIADFAYYGWVNSASYSGIDISGYRHVQRWFATLKADKDVVAAYVKIAEASAALSA